ncbi:hypothetical protein [Pseudonocardia lacus]|uniref:hypothetical protein n=1 Tax=Pseudonocardia lacus TaxID=2835865 RepID=UPI001BDC0314|nr:hypothetical protein [Pseudonocardia lacus]
MTRPPASGPTGRSAAVGDLFAALEGLLISYQALPDDERETRWDAEAELITGAVALHLSTARGRIAARSTPSSSSRAIPPARQLPDPAAETGPADDRRPA